MVPTLTRLGRFSEWIRALMVGAAVVTRGIMTPTIFYSLSGWLRLDHGSRGASRPRASSACRRHRSADDPTDVTGRGTSSSRS